MFANEVLVGFLVGVAVVLVLGMPFLVMRTIWRIFGSVGNAVRWMFNIGNNTSIWLENKRQGHVVVEMRFKQQDQTLAYERLYLSFGEAKKLRKMTNNFSGQI